VTDHFEHFVGARSGTKLIGVIGAEHYGDATLLRSLAVDEAARGTGLGGRLVTDFLDRERARGTATVFLLTTTADAFFQRLGFAPVGREEVPEAVKRSAEFLGACPASARAMAFRLL
jgi:amino-acid N-acetyltransferase